MYPSGMNLFQTNILVHYSEYWNFEFIDNQKMRLIDLNESEKELKETPISRYNANKKGFFGTVKDRFIKKGKNILNIKSKKDILKAIGYSDKDIKGN